VAPGRLTDEIICAALPYEKPYKLFDGGGLYIFITPKGSRVWRLKYRYRKAEKVLCLGPYPKVGLAKARRERAAAKAYLKAKKDPGPLFKLRRDRPSTPTFEAIARDWHEVNKRAWSEVHAADVLLSLERDVFPALGEAAITDIRPPDILAVLQPVERRNAVETARRLRQRISAIFMFAAGMGLTETNPAAVVIGALAPVIRRRQPAVTTIEDAREVLQKAEAERAQQVTKLALRLLALTVVRPGTLITTPWTEFADVDDDPVWTIPAKRMKLRLQQKDDETRDHMVPLSRQAVEVIDALRKLSRRSPFVFPNLRRHHQPMSENAMGYLLNRAGYHHRHVPHGWRATFSTIMNERDPRDEKVIEAILAHVPKNKVAGAYNRALYLERRRVLLQDWAEMLLYGLPPPAKL
jgi:integrase